MLGHFFHWSRSLSDLGGRSEASGEYLTKMIDYQFALFSLIRNLYPDASAMRI